MIPRENFLISGTEKCDLTSRCYREAKYNACICLSQCTSSLYDCTLFKYLKNVKDSRDFKGTIYEENIGYSFFSLQNHVHTLQRLNFMQFDKILSLLKSIAI